MSSQYKKGYADKLMNTGLSARVIDSISEIAKKNNVDKEGCVLYEAI